VGDINTYALFAELARSLVNCNGRAGIIVPTGIATDDTYKDFFGDLNEKRGLASLYDFENREGLFPGVHRSYKFSLLTMSAKPVERADFAFFSTRTEHLRDPQRRFALTPDDFAFLNPNTRTCPVFRTRADAELTKKIYLRVPVLVNERTGENPWGIRFLTMFHMSNDSELFKKAPGDGLLPLYEGKMVQAYDHRAGSVVFVPDNKVRQSQPVQTVPAEYIDPSYVPSPLWWVATAEVNARLNAWRHKWLMGFKDVTSPTNERTAIFAVLPRVAVGHKVPLAFLTAVSHVKEVACFLTNVNALVFDYVARQKVGGLSLGYFFLKQLPVLNPRTYSLADMEEICPSVLELVYTAWDIKPFADDLWRQSEERFRQRILCELEEHKTATGGHEFNPPEWAEIAEDGIPLAPFKWDEDRRACLRADLDAYYAHLYGLTRDELRYILDPKDVYGPDFPSETFRVLKEKEEKLYGEYRTRRLVLEAFDTLAESPRFRDEMPKRVSAFETPPKGGGAAAKV
jgi:hypothetical protein